MQIKQFKLEYFYITFSLRGIRLPTAGSSTWYRYLVSTLTGMWGVLLHTGFMYPRLLTFSIDSMFMLMVCILFCFSLEYGLIWLTPLLIARSSRVAEDIYANVHFLSEFIVQFFWHWTSPPVHVLICYYFVTVLSWINIIQSRFFLPEKNIYLSNIFYNFNLVIWMHEVYKFFSLFSLYLFFLY